MQKWGKLLSVLFSFFLMLYLVLFLVENIFPGFVSNAFSLTYMLYPVLIFGVLSALFPLQDTEVKPDIFHKSDVYLAVVLSVLGAGLIYYKIDLGYPLRLIIAALAGLLILLTSLLIVIPEDYKFIVPKFKWIYFVIFVAVGISGYVIIQKIPKTEQASQTITRLEASKYKLVLVNQSTKVEYQKSYEQLLINNGYTNIEIVKPDAYPPVTSTTIMFDEVDSAAADEITELLSQSYGAVQKAPLAVSGDHQIIIILAKVATQ